MTTYEEIVSTLNEDEVFLLLSSLMDTQPEDAKSVFKAFLIKEKKLAREDVLNHGCIFCKGEKKSEVMCCGVCYKEEQAQLTKQKEKAEAVLTQYAECDCVNHDDYCPYHKEQKEKITRLENALREIEKECSMPFSPHSGIMHILAITKKALQEVEK